MLLLSVGLVVDASWRGVNAERCDNSYSAQLHGSLCDSTWVDPIECNRK